MEHITPFGHALVGLYALSPPNFNVNYNLGVTAGGGFDVGITPRVDWRLVQADLQYGRFNGALVGQKAEFTGARLATGLVFKFGTLGPPPVPPSAACSAKPTEVFEGEPVTVTATPSNFNPKRTLSYAWSGTGVQVSSTTGTANIDTKGLKPGSYPLKASITDGKKGMADCTASFTVKEPRPPTISCSANPTTVQPNGTAQITSTGSSPDGRNLTYSYTASAGNVSGTGSSATLNTAGAQPGPITVNCNVSDDRNLTAASTTTVTVEAPPPPPPPPAAPESSKLNEIAFKKNSPRVDNAAKAILDEVALRLQRDADAKAVLIGQADAKEANAKKLAAQRAVNAKSYLVAEKGIDASRIEVRTGSGNAMSTEIWLVPAGATFNQEGTSLVSEKVKPSATKRAAPAKKAPKKQ
jgi:outer membrane protein OmpA-like peptidoglycan-associated protein